MDNFFFEHGKIETMVGRLVRLKQRLLEVHQEVERCQLPEASREIHQDALRAVRGSVAYIDVLVAEVYANGDGLTGDVIPNAKGIQLGTHEFDRALLDSSLLEDEG